MQLFKNLLKPRYSGVKVFVTGIPRSGTSFLTGLISQMGFSLGSKKSLKPANEHNRYGYFENRSIMSISDSILKQLGGSFHELPNFHKNWAADFPDEKEQILSLVNKQRIELIKDNRLLVLSDLYDELFPDALWIYISRHIDERFDSQFGNMMTFDELENLTKKRLAIWYSGSASQKALNLDYEDFKSNIDQSIEIISCHLGIVLSERQRERCRNFFRPRN